MGIEDILRGLMFDQQRAEANPDMGQPAPAPPPPQGGIFGGLKGWAPDEKIMGYADAAEEGAPARGLTAPPAAMPPRSDDMPVPPETIPLQMRKFPVGMPPPAAAPPPAGPPVNAPPAAQPGFLGALGLTPDRAAMLKRSLAGGLSAVKSSPFAMESFAHGAGGALAGGNQYEDSQDTRKQAALNSAINMKRNDQSHDYRMGQLGVSKGNLDVNRANSESLAELRKAQAARPGAWNKPPHQIQIEVDKYLLNAGKEIDKKYAPAPGDLPAVRAEKQAAAAAEKAKIKEEKYQQYGIGAGGVGGPAGGGGAVGGVITREKYDALPPGTPYQHPKDPPGKLRIKGGGAPGAAPPPADTVPDEEDGT